MDPISATVASIVTGFLAKGAAAVAEAAGAAVRDAAATIAQTVLDRLRADPAEQRTVDRVERDPEAQQAALEAAVSDLVAADEAFAAQLGELVATYNSAKAAAGGVGVEVHGNVEGPLTIGDRNLVIDRTSGTVRIGRDDDPA